MRETGFQSWPPTLSLLTLYLPFPKRSAQHLVALRLGVESAFLFLVIYETLCYLNCGIVHQARHMPFRAFATTLSALASLLLSPLEPIRASTFPASSAHSCLPDDFEFLRSRSIVSPASKRAVGLNVGDPLTVRLIYFVPSDREAQDDIDEKLDSMIRNLQESYAEQMENHGFGSKTFRFETDAAGKAVVHHVEGNFDDAYYLTETFSKVVEQETAEQFDGSRNIYLIALDVSNAKIDGYCGQAARLGPESGTALIPAPDSGLKLERGWSCFNVSVAAHELGHAFGLAHDHFRSTTRSPSSYHTDWMVTSFPAAQWFDAHRYFNTGRAYPESDEQTTIEMLPPLSVPPLSVRLRFELSDPDGLHQAQLHNAGGEAIDSEGVKGQAATVEFVTTEVTEAPANRVSLRVVDVHGNVTHQEHPVAITTLLPEESVSIPSANLGSLVRERLGLDSDETVTQIDMLRLTGFEATGLEIANISGLESAVNLKALFLSDNQIEDLSPISGSTILESLDLNQNNVSDISSLADMANLTTLGLSGNAVTDLSPLADLAVLNSLELQGNEVSDISSLAGAANLGFLGLRGNPVTDLSPLEGLEWLSHLDLVGTSTADLSPLEQLARLTRLRFGGDLVTDLSPVAGLTRLTQLEIVGDSISDLSPLAGLTELTFLDFGGNSVSDLSPLGGLTELAWLRFSQNSVSDLSSLAGLTELTFLDFQGNSVSDLSPLSALHRLTHLSLDRNAVSDLSPLAGMTQLAHLSLVGNSVSDLSPLSALHRLTHLSLDRNAVSDLSPLAGMTQLADLSLVGNTVSELSALSGLFNLRGLNLWENPVSDLSPLAGLTQLRFLGLWSSPVSDLSPLARLDALTHLHVVGGSVDDLSALAGLTRLEELNVSENSISDVSPLAGMTHLSYLYLASNSVTDISSLTGLTGLRRLELSGNPLSDRSIDTHIPALRSRGVIVLFEDP